ncbi:protein kinase family protein [Thalassospira xiamenensis]|uniref:Serine/threonine protein kinase n=1 Tax=Thalassospira xiamenensis TaxID=220697 RepID=A0A285TT92_9PROT|nr:protein kinase family protein [Thalassospira xiamenensis]SOC27076.1 Serine/threonine protein kinase [Thalassospira xiamenensis]
MLPLHAAASLPHLPYTLTGSSGVEYHINKLKACGAHGTVYFGWETLTKSARAFKIVNGAENGSSSSSSEVELLEKLRHPGVIYMFEAIELPNGATCIVLEWAHTTLGQLLRERSQYPSFWKLDHNRMVQKAARDILPSLHFIHQNGLVHKDIQIDNILLVFQNNILHDIRAQQPGRMMGTPSIQFKIGDMGIASHRDKISADSNFRVDSRPPEAIRFSEFDDKDHPVDQRVDIYQFAFCLLQLYSMQELKCSPFHVCDGVPARLAQSMATDIADLIADGLNKDPKKRPTSAYEYLRKFSCLSSAYWGQISSTKHINEFVRNHSWFP